MFHQCYARQGQSERLLFLSLIFSQELVLASRPSQFLLVIISQPLGYNVSISLISVIYNRLPSTSIPEFPNTYAFIVNWTTIIDVFNFIIPILMSRIT